MEGPSLRIGRMIPGPTEAFELVALLLNNGPQETILLIRSRVVGKLDIHPTTLLTVVCSSDDLLSNENLWMCIPSGGPRTLSFLRLAQDAFALSIVQQRTVKMT